MIIALLFLFLQAPAQPTGLTATVDPGSVPYATYAAQCRAKNLTPFLSDSYYSYGFDTSKRTYCLADTTSPDFTGQQEWR